MLVSEGGNKWTCKLKLLYGGMELLIAKDNSGIYHIMIYLTFSLTEQNEMVITNVQSFNRQVCIHDQHEHKQSP